MKVLLVCKKRLSEYGTTFGLVNSAKCISTYLSNNNIENKLVLVNDSNDIDREVTDYNPTHIFVQAIWIPPVKMKELLNIPRHKDRSWIIRIHSKAPFLANEGIAVKWIREYSELNSEFKNLYVAPNTEELTSDLQLIFPQGRFVFLPNIYPFEECTVREMKNDTNIVKIGCFGAIRPLKNQFIQAIAAIKFAKRIKKTLEFHINVNRVEQNGEAAYKNIKELFTMGSNTLVEHKWYPLEVFIPLVRSMDIGMQVSLTESFNLVTADFVANGVPVVVSHDIEWMPFLLKVSPTSSEDIASKLEFVYNKSWFLNYLAKTSLQKYNRDSEKIWERFLKLHTGHGHGSDHIDSGPGNIHDY